MAKKITLRNHIALIARTVAHLERLQSIEGSGIVTVDKIIVVTTIGQTLGTLRQRLRDLALEAELKAGNHGR